MISAVQATALKRDPFAGERIAAENLPFADFLRQFDGQHAEWHEGRVILVMANNFQHQTVLLTLAVMLKFYFSFNPIAKFVTAGFSQRLSNDLPHREPDIMIILNENLERIKNSYLEGPADIAIEIVSPESIARDYGPKFQEYRAGGVREYWIIDPARQVIDIHVLGEDQQYHPLSRDAAGQVISSILPNFAFPPEILWREEEPSGPELVALVQRMGQGK
jgi:Uma2 family endonuclease